MNLLEASLPDLSLQPDVAPGAFFDRCEAIAERRGYYADRRRAYAGEGYDQLNVHFGVTQENVPMVRMVATPRGNHRLAVDVVTRWPTYPVTYDDYVPVAKAACRQLLADYAHDYGTRLRIGVPRKPITIDWEAINCGEIAYAQLKFREAIRSMAIDGGDVRERLRTAFLTIHVIRPDDVPPPLREHLAWVYAQLTRREARYPGEGTLDATLARMHRSTGERIAQRMLAIADALDKIHQFCEQRS